jgi:hypothetical protein
MHGRKSQTKKVVCIPAAAAPPGLGGRPSTSGEVVPSDLWAWRDYGQKPIKGSPYPRGYYRCSNSKDCSARKQVERSRTDPSMLVITYTSDHTTTHGQRSATCLPARPGCRPRPQLQPRATTPPRLAPSFLRHCIIITTPPASSATVPRQAPSMVMFFITSRRCWT